jgi:hypothetical protein
MRENLISVLIYLISTLMIGQDGFSARCDAIYGCFNGFFSTFSGIFESDRMQNGSYREQTVSLII